jgi:hypothetical protein
MARVLALSPISISPYRNNAMPCRAKAREFFIEPSPQNLSIEGQGSRENGSPVSAISPRVGERSSNPQGWKVIFL